MTKSAMTNGENDVSDLVQIVRVAKTMLADSVRSTQDEPSRCNILKLVNVLWTLIDGRLKHTTADVKVAVVEIS